MKENYLKRIIPLRYIHIPPATMLAKQTTNSLRSLKRVRPVHWNKYTKNNNKRVVSTIV